MSLLERSWDKVASDDGSPLKGAASWITPESYQSLAEKYLAENDTLDEAVSSLVTWQAGQAGAVGAINGLPGLLMAGVTIPLDIAGVTFIQIRMIAAIAKMNGHEINSPEVRTIGLCALLGASATEAVAAVASQVAMKVAGNAVTAIPGRIWIEIIRQIGMRLLTKYGSTGIIRFSKVIPVVGALFGDGVNAFGTYGVGHAAHALFRKPSAEAVPVTIDPEGSEAMIYDRPEDCRCPIKHSALVRKSLRLTVVACVTMTIGSVQAHASASCDKATSAALIIQSNAATDAKLAALNSESRAIRTGTFDPDSPEVVATEDKIAALYADARERSIQLYRSGCKSGETITIDIGSIVKSLCDLSKSVVKMDDETICVLKSE